MIKNKAGRKKQKKRKKTEINLFFQKKSCIIIHGNDLERKLNNETEQ